MTAAPHKVVAQLFVDLDSARRFKKPPWDPDKEGSISFKSRVAFVVDFFAEMQMRVLASIVTLRPEESVTIRQSRIYHGWHRGITPTDDRRIWEEASAQFRAYTISKASFLPDIFFGNELSCASARCPIFDTLRINNGVERQKLVDTALVADLLCFTRSESAGFRRGGKPSAIGIIIADDDDLYPGLFVAEQWGLPVHMLRVTRNKENKHLQVAGIATKL